MLVMPLVAFLAVSAPLPSGPSQKPAAPQRGSLSLRPSATVAVAPAQVRVTGYLRGSVTDDETYYCPTVRWEWGDGTASEETSDCQPFEANKSDVRRSFMAEHTYRTGGQYTVTLILKKARKVVARAVAWLSIGASSDEGRFIR